MRERQSWQNNSQTVKICCSAYQPGICHCQHLHTRRHDTIRVYVCLVSTFVWLPLPATENHKFYLTHDLLICDNVETNNWNYTVVTMPGRWSTQWSILFIFLWIFASHFCAIKKTGLNLCLAPAENVKNSSSKKRLRCVKQEAST